MNWYTGNDVKFYYNEQVTARRKQYPVLQNKNEYKDELQALLTHGYVKFEDFFN